MFRAARRVTTGSPEADSGARSYLGERGVTVEDALADYQFNKHVIHHLFCTTCGIKPFARGKMPDGTPTVAVNVRCLDDADLDALTIQKYDGKSH